MIDAPPKPARWGGPRVAGGVSVLAQGVGNAMLNGSTLVLNFGATLLFSRELGADGFGAFAFAYALAMLLSVPAVLGLTPLLVREITAYRLRGSWGRIRGLFRRANHVVLVASLGLGAASAAAFAVTGWPHAALHRPALLALPLVALVAVTSVRQGVMQGFGRVILGRAPEAVIGPALLLLLAGLAAAVLGSRFTATWAIAAADAAALVAAFVGVLFLRRTLPAETRALRPEYETRRWARAAAPLILFSVVQTAGAQLPTVLLGSLGTPHDVGLYNVAFRVSNLLPFLLVAATPALMPAIAELDATRRSDELQRVTSRSARLVFAGTLPIALVALVLTVPLLHVFGPDFGGGATPLRILAAAQLVNIACGFPGTVLIMVGEAGVMTATFAVTTTLTLALAAALIPALGATGAAFAAAAGLVSSNAILAVVLWRRRGIYAPALLRRAFVRP
ncbi:MAG TPA: oligosaccharide flippase family protein [Gaiellaceae bacterium]|nr:oligosaccharide flippase family protein [Gaiellaceae bacterium]